MAEDYKFCPFCARELQVKIEEEEKKRKYCGACHWTHYPGPKVAVAAVITEVNESYQPCVLVVKRKREPFKETWMFPAGFLELGEHPEKALARELKEETGLVVKSLRLLKIVKSISDPRSPDQLVIFYHVLEVTGDITNNDPDENLAIEWKPVKDPLNIGFPHHRVVLDEIKANIVKYFDYDFKI